jgi:hypothetical protein
MTLQTVTLDMPLPLYNRLQEKAAQSKRTVEAELLETIAAALPLTDDGALDSTELKSSLTLLDADNLWRIARTHFPLDRSTQLENLHFKRQELELNEMEAREAADLTRQYDRAMLIRAEAIALLIQRGHDTSLLSLSTYLQTSE